MKKGKSRTRAGRRDILRTNAANQRRKVRQQARQQQARSRYDRTRYDGSQKEES